VAEGTGSPWPVQQVRPSDVGVYTCVAGSAHEHFVLQVLGSKRKVAAPEPRPQEAGPDGTFGREFWASLNRYDAFVEQLLELRRSLLEDAAKPGGKNKGNPEDGGSEPPGLFVLIADTYRLDRLLSDGGLGGPRAPQLVAQLFRQLTAAHGDANESTLHPPDGAESSTPAPFLFKPRIKAQTSKSPLIIQRPPKFQPPSADMVVAVGAPVLLQRPFSSLELSCEVLGSPEPSVTWTRNGKKLQQNVALMSSGSLKIQSPNKLDEGLYTCTARNRLGSASLSSWLQIIGRDIKPSAFLLVQGEEGDTVTRRAQMEPTLVLRGKTAATQRRRVLGHAATTGRPLLLHLQAPPWRTGPGLTFPSWSHVPVLVSRSRLSRWQAEPWSPCSASCGGGSQTRSVRCLTGSEGVWSEGGGPACLAAGRKPADARLCNQLPCARWGATHWGPVSSPRLPGVLKNCSTQACVLEWRVGAWTPCTATCGRHGFQSRPVTCAHVRSGKVAKEHQCAWKPAPPAGSAATFSHVVEVRITPRQARVT
uniref:Ig-like domain-containing protein n=1 Tax=Takifugu rubripes TaxID=31033 RepID=H2SH70_TAKRU